MTLNDIAKMANVSKSTVSRYLNKGAVSQKTREKLDKIVQETGYQPNLFAQSLKAEKSNMIGVIIPRYDSPSTNQVMKGIDTIANEKDMQLMIMNSDLDIQRTKKNVTVLERQKVGAIILFATAIDEELTQQLHSSKVPIIIVGQQLAGITSFTYQDYEAGQTIAQHAIDIGHRELLFVGVTEEDYAVGVLRKKGFYDIAKEHGAKIRFIETNFSRAYSYQKALDFLPEMKETYIAAATDHIAIGIFSASVELGMQIPEDVSLSGFGGYSVTQNVFPHITTVAYPFYQMGETVILETLKIIENEAKTIDLLTQLPVELIVQGST